MWVASSAARPAGPEHSDILKRWVRHLPGPGAGSCHPSSDRKDSMEDSEDLRMPGRVRGRLQSGLPGRHQNPQLRPLQGPAVRQKLL